MSSLNFFEQFAAINVSESSSVVEQDLVKNMSTIHLDNQNQDVEKTKKIQKNLKNEEKTKKYRFIHGNNIIMTNGQYKGYNGFVYDYFPSMASFSIEEEIYVLAAQYGEKKIGDEIMTSSGSGVIVSKIGELLNVCIGEMDIRLPRFCFARYVTFMDNNILKIAQLLKIHGDKYEMVVMKFDYSKIFDAQDLVKVVSDSFKSGEFFYGDEVMVSVSNCRDEFYFVCKHPENSDESDYYGRYGRLRLEIPDQYLVSIKRTVTVNKSMTSTQGKRVKVERGLYKNKEGDLVNVESAYLNVQIEAINKKITNHYAHLSNGIFQIRKIIPSDVFFIDCELMNGNYFQVEECYADYYVGFERSEGCVEKKTISKVEVKTFMSGFTITDTKFVSSFEKQTEEKFVLDTIQEDQDQEVQDDEVVETDNVDYENGFDETVMDVDQFENTEGQMKETFRDIERSGFVQRSLSKDEKEYMKMIEKCGSAIGDVQDSYVLLDKISDAVKMMRSELEKISIVDWSSSDVKYIVACLVAYEILKTGYPMTIYEFRKYVQKLYDTNYLNKSSIANSGFVRCENLAIDSMWKIIEMTNDEKKEFKTLYKNQKYDSLVKDIMERCHKMLCAWFEPVVFSKGSVDLDLIKVSETKHKVKAYPKYFLTTSDILNNVTSKDANKILWGPNSQKLVNVWKESLVKKLEKEDNKTAKCIYEFVKDNIDNAPFILPTLEKSEDKLDKLKYKELKRAFETFTEKLRVYVGKQTDEKNMRIEQSMQESLRIAEKRMGMSEKRNRDETTETNDETNDETNPEFVKSSSCKIFI
jgi:hypothetical protein